MRRTSVCGNRGCIANSLLFLVIVFIPVVGHIIETVMLFEDEHSAAGTILWLVVIWTTPFIGPLLYPLFRPRHKQVMFCRPIYRFLQPQPQYPHLPPARVSAF